MVEMEKAFRSMQVSLDTFKKERKKLMKSKDLNQTQILETQRLIKTEVIDATDEIEILKEILKKQDLKLQIQHKLLQRVLDQRNQDQPKSAQMGDSLTSSNINALIDYKDPGK